MCRDGKYPVLQFAKNWRKPWLPIAILRWSGVVVDGKSVVIHQYIFQFPKIKLKEDFSQWMLENQ